MDGRTAGAGRGMLTAHEVWAAEPTVRRVIAARVHNPTVVDDLVQDALERLLRAQRRIDGSFLVPYAVVTARNVVASHARRAGREEPQADVDPSAVAAPADDRVVAEEDRLAVREALARLPEQERAWLVAHEAAGVPVGELDGGGASAATMRVRLARARARLRVEYAVVTAGVDLPTGGCRPTLLALAGGERARGARAGQHLLDCETCAGLSPEVVARRPGLALVIPVLGWRWFGHAVKAHPAVSSAGGAVTVAAAVAVAAASGNRPATPAPSRPVAAVTAPVGRASAPSVVVAGLSVAGRPVSISGGVLRRPAGPPVVARGALVQSVVTHNGFWVGSAPAARVFVELVGPRRSLLVTAGEHVSFTAPLVAHRPGYAATVGVSVAEGAAQLNAEGAHLAVSTTALSVDP